MIVLKKILLLLIAVLSAVSFLSCEGLGTITPNPASSGNSPSSAIGSNGSDSFSVEIPSIGKADCIILNTKEHLIVIDLGIKDLAETIVTRISSYGKEIDALIISHYDKDHIGATKKLLGAVKVKSVYLPEYEDEKTENAEEVKGYLTKHAITPTTVSEEIALEYDGVSFTIYPTGIFFKRNDNGSNESSIVVSALHGENRFLFTGDAVDRRLPEILSQLPDPAAVDFLKVPHHGVYDDNSKAFFEAICPTYAVITCSAAEPADGSTVKLLNDLGAKVYLTSSGSVFAYSDGSSIRIEVKEND